MIKWYWRWWAFPEVYMGDAYNLYVKNMSFIFDQNGNLINKQCFTIMFLADFFISKEMKDRPAEAWALANLYRQSLKAEILRLSDDTKRTANLQTTS